MGGLSGRIEARDEGVTHKAGSINMRTSIDFNEYRAWYYFFQYQFFVRSEQGAKRNVPESRIAQFLQNLANDPHRAHYLWEVPPISQSMKPKRKPRGSDPVAPGMGRVVLYKAKKRSIRQRYMLFNFPKRHRSDHIPILYKSLIVFDMIHSGTTEYAATKQMITQFETIPSISRLRSQSKWYDILFENNVGKFELSEITDGRAIEKYPSRFFGTDPVKIPSALKGDREAQHEPVRSRVRDIHRYKKIADVLIRLTETGQFQTFPSQISAIK